MKKYKIMKKGKMENGQGIYYEIDFGRANDTLLFFNSGHNWEVKFDICYFNHEELIFIASILRGLNSNEKV